MGKSAECRRGRNGACRLAKYMARSESSRYDMNRGVESIRFIWGSPQCQTLSHLRMNPNPRTSFNTYCSRKLPHTQD